MTKDFANIQACRKQVVKGRSLRIGSDGFLGKGFGIAITGIMLIGFCGTIFMGSMLKASLEEMGNKEMAKKELIQSQKRLLAEKTQLLAKGNFELAASDIGLYPVSPSQMKHF
jgi:hypothetical protein